MTTFSEHTPTLPIAAIKAELPLAWVLLRYGVTPERAPDGRLVCPCPFHDDAEPSFAIYDAGGSEKAGCWSCADKGSGDVLDLVGWLEGTADVAKKRARASELVAEFRDDATWAARRDAFRPVARPKASPDEVAEYVRDAQALVRDHDDTAIRRLIAWKRDGTVHGDGSVDEPEPGWLAVGRDYLVNVWGLGAEDDHRVVIPHIGIDGSVHGAKTRAYWSKGAFAGSSLNRLYGEWMLGIEGRQNLPVLLCEGESDTWCAYAVLYPSYNVLGLPSGASATPRREWLEQLSGRDVILGFDGDEPGRQATEKWALNLSGVARSVAVVPVPAGRDLAKLPSIPTAVAMAEVQPSRDALLAEAMDALESTDVGRERRDRWNGELLAALFSDRYRYHRERERWYFFDGRRWVKDDRRASRASRAVWALADWLAAKADQLAESDAELAEAVRTRASMLNDNSMVRRTLEAAQVTDAMGAGQADFDRDPWLLNLLNGTLDLQTGQLRPHDPRDLITKVSPIEHDPSARSAAWETFLRDVLPDDAEREYAVAVLGASLVGEPLGERSFVNVWGAGGAGKSTLADAVLSALGDYGTTLGVDTLSKSRYGRNTAAASPDLVQLEGARLVVVEEVPEARQANTALIKQLTGGGNFIRARDLHEGEIGFRAQFLLLVLGNHRFVMGSDTGGAMQRRTVMLHLRHAKPEGERDPALALELRDPTRSGAAILNTLLGGLRRARAGGLVMPESIRREVGEYYEQEREADPIHSFLDEHWREGGRGLPRADKPKVPGPQVSKLARDHGLISPSGPCTSATTLFKKLRDAFAEKGWEVEQAKGAQGHQVFYGLEPLPPETGGL